MMKQLEVFLFAVFLATAAWSQDAVEAGNAAAADTTDTPDAAEVSEAGKSDDEDDADLDVPGYKDEEEDDFIPSEEVSADQSLPFPVDI